MSAGAGGSPSGETMGASPQHQNGALVREAACYPSYKSSASQAWFKRGPSTCRQMRCHLPSHPVSGLLMLMLSTCSARHRLKHQAQIHSFSPPHLQEDSTALPSEAQRLRTVLAPIGGHWERWCQEVGGGGSSMVDPNAKDQEFPRPKEESGGEGHTVSETDRPHT